MRAAAWLLALLFAPGAAAVPTTLYAHLWGPIADFPFNTQEPDPSFGFDSWSGLTPTLSCLPETPVLSPSDLHALYGYPLPDLVDDLQGNAAGIPRIPPERGLLGDVRLDPEVAMVLHWYWSAALPSGLPQQSLPVPVPNVVVRATMRTGDSISVDGKAYDTGPVIAVGESAAALLAGDLSQGVEHDTVGGRIVYHFVVPLQLKEPVIPRTTAFNLKVETFVRSPACPDDRHIMPSTVALHSSPGHRPRLELGVIEPLRLEYMHPQFVGPDFVLDTAVIDGWGAYDVKVTALSVEGSGIAISLNGAPRPSTLHCHCERGYGPEGLAQRWVLNGTRQLPAGNYTAHMTATTLQGATQEWDFSFRVPDEKQSPSPALPLALLALAPALAVRRRQP